MSQCRRKKDATPEKRIIKGASQVPRTMCAGLSDSTLTNRVSTEQEKTKRKHKKPKSCAAAATSPPSMDRRTSPSRSTPPAEDQMPVTPVDGLDRAGWKPA